MRGFVAFLVCFCLASSGVLAQDLHFDGMADLRLVVPSSQSSNLDGGLGKLRWGDDHGDTLWPEIGQLALRGVVGVTPDLRLVGEIRYDPQQKTAVDVLDAFARWRPVSTTRWRWSVKGGAFFVPVSLENTGIGWTSEWTLTPSAINSWVGDELRTIGTEIMLEWRGDVDHLEVTLAGFGWNQPAGVALADRGWSFNGRAIGLFDSLRLPNVIAQSRAAPGQPSGALYTDEFRQIDSSPGWYGGVAWERPEFGRIAVLRYDNEANPSAHDSEFAWHTQFWSASVSSGIGDVVLLAQAMAGSTEIAPGGSSSKTDFWAAYVLAGYERDKWRYAVRVDEFGTSGPSSNGSVSTSEHGTALTTAVTWSPLKFLSVIGEVLAIDYTRPQRVLEGLPSHAIEGQAQMAVRISF
jgi:hypothetical protein